MNTMQATFKDNKKHIEGEIQAFFIVTRFKLLFLVTTYRLKISFFFRRIFKALSIIIFEFIIICIDKWIKITRKKGGNKSE